MRTMLILKKSKCPYNYACDKLKEGEEMKCPKCGKKVYWNEISCGGDGLLMCDNCEWVEDVTHKAKEANK